MIDQNATQLSDQDAGRGESSVLASFTLKTASADEAALLKAKDYVCLGAHVEGPQILFHFQDPNGDAARLLGRHATNGTNANSRSLLNAYRWVMEQYKAIQMNVYLAGRES